MLKADEGGVRLGIRPSNCKSTRAGVSTRSIMGTTAERTREESGIHAHSLSALYRGTKTSGRQR